MFSNLSSLFGTQPATDCTQQQPGTRPSILDRLRRWTNPSTQRRNSDDEELENMTLKVSKTPKKKQSNVEGGGRVVKREPTQLTNGDKVSNARRQTSHNEPMEVDGEAVSKRLRHRDNHVQPSTSSASKPSSLTLPVSTNVSPAKKASKSPKKKSKSIAADLKAEVTEADESVSTVFDAWKNVSSRKQRPGRSRKQAVIEDEPSSCAENVEPENQPSTSGSEDEAPSSPITKRLRSRQHPMATPAGNKHVVEVDDKPPSAPVNSHSPARRQKVDETTVAGPSSIVNGITKPENSVKSLQRTTSKPASTPKKRTSKSTVAKVNVDHQASPKTSLTMSRDTVEDAPSSPVTHRTRSHISQASSIALSTNATGTEASMIEKALTTVQTVSAVSTDSGRRQPKKRSLPKSPVIETTTKQTDEPVAPPKLPKKSKSQNHPPTPAASPNKTPRRQGNQGQLPKKPVELASEAVVTLVKQKNLLQSSAEPILSPAQQPRNNEPTPEKKTVNSRVKSGGSSTTRRQQPSSSAFSSSEAVRRHNNALFSTSSPIACSSTDPLPSSYCDNDGDECDNEPVASTSAEWYQAIQKQRQSVRHNFDFGSSTRKASPRKIEAHFTNPIPRTPPRKRQVSPTKKRVSFSVPDNTKVSQTSNGPSTCSLNDICKVGSIELVNFDDKPQNPKIVAFRKMKKKIRRVFTRPYRWKLQQPDTTRRRREEKPELCTICLEDMKYVPTLQCIECEIKFHPYCVGYRNRPERDDWLCSDCIRCEACDDYISDPYNVQCNVCNVAYHGDCMPEGSMPSIAPFHRWICNDCAKCVEILINTAPDQTETVSKKSKSPTKQSKDYKPVNPNIIQLSHGNDVFSTDLMVNLINPKKVKQYRYSRKARPSIAATPQQRLMERLYNLSKMALYVLTEANVFEDVEEGERFTKKLRDHFESLRHNSIFVKRGPDPYENPRFDLFKREEPAKRTKRSPQKAAEKEGDEKKRLAYLSQFGCSTAVQNYDAAVKSAKPIEEMYKKCYDEIVAQLPFSKHIHCYVWFNLGVLAPVSSDTHPPFGDYEPLVLMCQKCFDTFDDIGKMQLHMNVCRYYHPPGKEIYRDEIPVAHGETRTVSLFEVIGDDNLVYCELLCNLASFFISSKSSNDENDNFHYFILTEFDETMGFLPVGYFSKALEPEFNNNLACLLVLPQYRGRGYGKFLIDISYEMSRRDNRWGFPEEPLSNDGLSLYRSYWRGIIYEHLRKHRFDDGISLRELCDETHIHMDDLTTMLQVDDIVSFDKNDTPHFNCAKAWCSDLKLLRRLKFKPELLWWEPAYDPSAPGHRAYYTYESETSSDETSSDSDLDSELDIDDSDNDDNVDAAEKDTEEVDEELAEAEEEDVDNSSDEEDDGAEKKDVDSDGEDSDAETS